MSLDPDAEKVEWVFYRDRPEWKDLRPIPEDKGSFPIMVIQYSEKCLDVFDYFRAIVASGEKSQRALQLTEDAINLNPANYSVWQYRRTVLRALNYDLLEEMKFIENIIWDNQKNYQVWQHRKTVAEWLKSGPLELDFTESILRDDEKNYHAWQHRQWAINFFKLFCEPGNVFRREMDYVTSLLNRDMRNNSAWNHRYFILNNSGGFDSPEVLADELQFTLDSIKFITSNESSWNYLRGLLLRDEERGMGHPMVRAMIDKLYEEGKRSPYLLSFTVDVALAAMNDIKKKAGDEGKESCSFHYKVIVRVLNELAKTYDVIRESYWMFRLATFKEQWGYLAIAESD